MWGVYAGDNQFFMMKMSLKLNKSKHWKQERQNVLHFFVSELKIKIKFKKCERWTNEQMNVKSFIQQPACICVIIHCNSWSAKKYPPLPRNISCSEDDSCLTCYTTVNKKAACIQQGSVFVSNVIWLYRFLEGKDLWTTFTYNSCCWPRSKTNTVNIFVNN